ncbi:hypothetical protein [Oscillatoria sp. FACHB-1407]|nr:hypothetical protein [Oscillatoria sp. FACHB-1407]
MATSAFMNKKAIAPIQESDRLLSSGNQDCIVIPFSIDLRDS